MDHETVICQGKNDVDIVVKHQRRLAEFTPRYFALCRVSLESAKLEQIVRRAVALTARDHAVSEEPMLGQVSVISRTHDASRANDDLGTFCKRSAPLIGKREQSIASDKGGRGMLAPVVEVERPIGAGGLPVAGVDHGVVEVKNKSCHSEVPSIE